MKKINILLFAGLMVLIAYVFFAVQNRISVPVRFNFNDPKVYSLPVVMICSFIGGVIYGCAFTLIYKWKLAKEKRSIHNIMDYPKENGTVDNNTEDIFEQAKPLVPNLDNMMINPGPKLGNEKNNSITRHRKIKPIY